MNITHKEQQLHPYCFVNFLLTVDEIDDVRLLNLHPSTPSKELLFSLPPFNDFLS